jgi:hypothetical protein
MFFDFLLLPDISDIPNLSGNDAQEACLFFRELLIRSRGVVLSLRRV